LCESLVKSAAGTGNGSHPPVIQLPLRIPNSQHILEALVRISRKFSDTLAIPARIFSTVHFIVIGAMLFAIPAFAATFHEITVPGSQSTAANGINNSFQVVGFFEDSGGTHGFLLSQGTYQTLNFPGVTDFTVATGINNTNEIVGYFFSSAEHGFINRGGDYKQIDFPSATSTLPQSVNNKGEIAGVYTDASGKTHGFKFANGAWSTIDAPGATSTSAQGINDAGNVAGFYNDATGQHGFDLTRDGRFRTINFPNAEAASSATGINDNNQIVGQYLDPTLHKIQGFEFSNGQFNELQYPGASTTFPQGINNANFVVGSWFNSMGQQEGFLASPR
jgi:probable HAF family extracellular repeat protein